MFFYLDDKYNLIAAAVAKERFPNGNYRIEDETHLPPILVSEIIETDVYPEDYKDVLYKYVDGQWVPVDEVQTVRKPLDQGLPDTPTDDKK